MKKNDGGDRQKMLERVKKLLAMAEDASSPNEAAIAARRAKSLMDKYSIDHAETIGAALDLSQFTEREVGDPKVAFPVHLSILAPAIADYTDTKATFKVSIGPAPKYRRMKQIRFLGHEDDLELAAYLYTYLTRTIDKMTNEAGVKHIGPRISFKKGMVSEICDKLRAMKAEEEEWFRENSNSKALVVVDRKAAMLKEKFGIVRYRRTGTRYSDGGAMARGRAAGADVSIRRGLSGTSKGPAGYLK